MSPTTSQLRTILRYALFTLSAVCVWQALAPLARRPAEASPQPTAVVRELITKPIETLRPGMRVLAGNPEVDLHSLAPFQIVEADWRLVAYLMPKPDGSTLTVEMLQEFAELNGLDIGSKTPLSFPELGIEGNATIQAIAPCPTIEPAEFAEQRVITATFHHSAANVIDLQVASEKEPIGTTSNHPFWSEDRQTWVQAGDLKPEERLQLANGTLTQVTRLTPHTGPPVAVYNLTVEGTHTYHVGTSGVLVHNTANYIVAQNGTRVTGYTGHGINRAIGDGATRAGVSPKALLSALKNPKTIKVGVDPQGRPFQTFVGSQAKVVVNPSTGQIVSMNPLGRGGVR